MSIVLSRNNNSTAHQSKRAKEGVDLKLGLHEEKNVGTNVASEEQQQFDWVHIRGPTIRYIVFGANIDIVGVIKAGRDRERAAGDKYRRGIRKARK